jgi:light-dependent protochlorophyllide reductase
MSVQPVVIITGASSGVGLWAAKSLADRGWLVIMACRDLAKAERAAVETGIPASNRRIMHIDLGDQASVRRFVDEFHANGLALDALLLNAAVYLPRLEEPMRSPEGYEISVATNYFGHFLLAHLLIDDLKNALSARDTARCVRTLEGLKAEEAAPPLVLWVLANEARQRMHRAALLHAAKIDRIIKGVASGDLWDEFLQLSLRLTKA